MKDIAWMAPAIRCLVILVAAWLVRMAATRLIRAFRIRVAARMHDAEHVRRAETLGRVLRYLASVVVALVASVLVMDQAP